MDRPTTSRRIIDDLGYAIVYLVLPIGLVFSTRSVPLFVGFGVAGLALAMVRDGRLGRWPAAMKGFAASPIGYTGFALLAWAALNPHLGSPIGVDFAAWVKFALSLGLVVAWAGASDVAGGPDRVRLRRFQIAGLLIVGAIVIIELNTFSMLRVSVGLNRESSITNRPVVTMAVLAALLIANTAGRREAILTALVAAFSTAVVFLSESESAKLYVVVLAGALAAATLAPRLTATIGIVITIATLLFAPLLFAAIAIPDIPWLESILRHGNAAHRISIWQAFIPHIYDRPFVSFGIAAEHFVVSATDPATGAVTYPQWHTHSMLLQAWINFGFVGVVLLSIAGVLIAKQLAALAGWPGKVGIELFFGFLAIADVSHSAWKERWVVIVDFS
ncbi:MAG: O-antigen ligase family protein, partial [Hyphomicrobiales bacterium]|nr:O-antigen ligase family protein [Hyphomicrobiales bacterium]